MESVAYKRVCRFLKMFTEARHNSSRDELIIILSSNLQSPKYRPTLGNLIQYYETVLNIDERRHSQFVTYSTTNTTGVKFKHYIPDAQQTFNKINSF